LPLEEGGGAVKPGIGLLSAEVATCVMAWLVFSFVVDFSSDLRELQSVFVVAASLRFVGTVSMQKIRAVRARTPMLIARRQNPFFDMIVLLNQENTSTESRVRKASVAEHLIVFSNNPAAKSVRIGDYKDSAEEETRTPISRTVYKIAGEKSISF
jgi:hypothetical protein